MAIGRVRRSWTFADGDRTTGYGRELRRMDGFQLGNQNDGLHDMKEPLLIGLADQQGPAENYMMTAHRHW